MALVTTGSFDDFSVVPAKGPGADPDVRIIESFSMLAEAARTTPAASLQFGTSPEPRGLTLKRLHLMAGFQGLIKRVFNADSDIYFLAWGWDLSGEAIQGNSPIFFYPGAISGADSTLIPMRDDEEREFLGAGTILYPQRVITAGLALRLQIWESRKGQRDFGETLQKVAGEIQGSKLNGILTMATLATGVSGATVALVKEASLELAQLVGAILKARSDDYVDFYEGYFPSTEAWAPAEQTWKAHSTEIVLARI